jgi:hypothetical protein
MGPLSGRQAQKHVNRKFVLGAHPGKALGFPDDKVLESGPDADPDTPRLLRRNETIGLVRRLDGSIAPAT